MVVGKFEVRPGKAGIGSAAYFAPEASLKLDHLAEYNSKELTVVLWLYVDSMKTKGRSPVTSRGGVSRFP
jgi:hypothetical protein